MAVPGVILLRKRLQFNALTVGMAIAVILAVLSFHGLIAFQKFNTRYHTPLFMLAAPVMAVFIAAIVTNVFAAARSRQQQRRQRRRRQHNAAPDNASVGNRIGGGGRRVVIAAAVFLILSIPWVVFNSSWAVFWANSGLGVFSQCRGAVFFDRRAEMYFNSYADIRQAYIAAIEYLAGRGPESVGIYMELDHYDYPVAALFRGIVVDVLRLEQIGVTNVSAGLRDGEFAPEYVFSTKGGAEVIEGHRYGVERQFRPVAILVRADVARE